MSKQQHTPGPWINFPNDPEVMTAPMGLIKICKVYQISEKDHGEANARLIAAAPELLEALKGFIYSVEHEGVIHGRVVSAVENARQAIAKATEGQTV